MHRLRGNERCPGTNAAVNTAAHTRAWRSNKATGKRAHSRHDTHNYATPDRASGNRANKSVGAARNDESGANTDDPPANGGSGTNASTDTVTW
jgi:hypothetical protein